MRSQLSLHNLLVQVKELVVDVNQSGQVLVRTVDQLVEVMRQLGMFLLQLLHLRQDLWFEHRVRVRLSLLPFTFLPDTIYSRKLLLGQIQDRIQDPHGLIFGRPQVIGVQHNRCWKGVSGHPTLQVRVQAAIVADHLPIRWLLVGAIFAYVLGRLRTSLSVTLGTLDHA